MIDLYVYAALLLAFVALFTREVIAPASRNTCDRRWLLMSASIGVVTVLITLALGWVFAQAIRTHALLPVPAHWPAWVVGMLSFLLTSFIFYWWHRLIHASDWLWRWTHQLHHSARRIESLTAFYAHPLDTTAAVLIGCLSSYVILGASPVAAAFALLLTGLFELFLHADLRTPRWLGWIVQRPESHAVHHARRCSPCMCSTLRAPGLSGVTRSCRSSTFWVISSNSPANSRSSRASAMCAGLGATLASAARRIS